MPFRAHTGSAFLVAARGETRIVREKLGLSVDFVISSCLVRFLSGAFGTGHGVHRSLTRHFSHDKDIREAIYEQTEALYRALPF